MEFHLYLPQMRTAPPALVEKARAAEAAGFDGIALMDHLDPPAAEGQPMYEAFTTATWIAAHTERLIIGHLVLCDAFRFPAMLARQAVTLDHCSAGRFELGLGTGSRPAELRRYGVPAGDAIERGGRLGETAQVLQRLWTGEVFDFDGEHHRLRAAQQLPTPLGRIPIVIGGVGAQTLELVREHADWWNVPMAELARLDELRPLAGDARVSALVMVGFVHDEDERDTIVDTVVRRFGPVHIGLVVGSADELTRHIEMLRCHGVDRCYVWFTDFAPPSTLTAFGDEVIKNCR